MSNAVLPVDFSSVTELPGSPATRPQLERLAQRYRFAARQTSGRRVLEIGCGAGLGLGWLAEQAASVIGGDCTERLLSQARAHYGERLPLVRFDAHDLPFAEASFDAILLFETVYYFRDLQRVLREGRRALSERGVLIVSSVNPEWSGFSPSSLSTDYVSVSGLCDSVKQVGFTSCECSGGFPAIEGSVRDKVVNAIRSIAVTLHLIPTTLEGRVLLKRLVYGRTLSLPPEITSRTVEVPETQPVLNDEPNTTHQIIYLIATRG